MEITADEYLVTGIRARGWLFSVETHFDLLSGRNSAKCSRKRAPQGKHNRKKCAVDGGLTLHESC